MRGHIKQRGKNKNNWSISIYLGRDKVTNKKKYKWLSFNGTKKEAEEYLTEKLQEINTGMFIDNKNMNIADYLYYWYEEYCIQNQVAGTYESYKRNIDNHIVPILGNILLKSLLPMHLQSFYSNRLKYGLSKTTVKYLHRIIHSALEQAMKWQLVIRNVADNVQAPKPDKYKAQVLTHEELITLIEIVKETNIYIPFMIAISTGMRRGEIAGLTWDNVDLDNGIIKVVQALYHTKKGLQFSTPKTPKSNRSISMPPTLITILKEHKEKQNNMRERLNENYENNNLICCHENGSIMFPDFITHKFAKILKKNKLPHIRFHDLRHSHASLLLMQGVQAKVISERLGHSNINITLDTYSHVYDATNKEVAQNFDKFLAYN